VQTPEAPAVKRVTPSQVKQPVEAPLPDRRAQIERATLREILMGAQDNLTNVLGVAIGAL
jgi:hypothetical protein